MTTSLEFYPG